MRDRQPLALAVQREPADRRAEGVAVRRLGRALRPDDRLAADAGDNQAGGGAGGEMLDPFRSERAQIGNAAVGRHAPHPAIVAAGDDRHAIGMAAGCKDRAVMRGDRRGIALRRDPTHAAVAKRHHRHIVDPDDRSGRGLDDNMAAVAIDQSRVRHAASAPHASKSRCNVSRSRLRPMKTIRLVRGSPGFQSRWVSPSSSMWTPCTT